MELIWLLIILILGGLLSWISCFVHPSLPRYTGFSAIILAVVFLIVLIIRYFSGSLSAEPILSIEYQWISKFGISIILEMDGLSMILVSLTFLLGVIAWVVSIDEIKSREGFYYFNLLWIIAGITGVFLARDLFLFYFFWEIMLVPMFFIIGIWGYEHRKHAAYKFFIYTQAGGLFMFLSILALYFYAGTHTGEYTFNFDVLKNLRIDPSVGKWIFGGLLLGFLIKLPAIPLHNWLPNAHTQAPTAGSVILAGLLLKTGAYGIIRFAVPLFPDMSVQFAPLAMVVGIVGIIYGAILAFAQTDLKRLIAYSSISHMGFIIIGAFSFNELAHKGVVLQIVAHGISTGALFILAGDIQHQTKTRNMARMGGFMKKMPFTGGLTIVFVLASLGMPGMINFLAEFFILAGSFHFFPVLTVIATSGLVFSVVYALYFMQKVFFGPHDEHVTVQNPVISKLSVLTIMALLIVFLGLYPKPLIKLANYPLKQLLTPEEVQKSARTVGETKVKLTFITNHSDSDETLYKKD